MITVCGLLHFWLLWCCGSFIPNALVLSLFFFFDISKVKTDFSLFFILEKKSENSLHK